MQKTNKYFSFAFFKDTLGRMFIPMLIASIVMVLSSLSTAAQYMLSLILSSGMSSGYIVTLTFFDINPMASNFATLFMPIVTVYAYSFLTKRGESDFYEAIPVTRLAMLVSGALALISVSAVILVVSTVVPLIILIPCYGKIITVSLGRVIISLLATVLASVLAVFASIVAISVTGKISNAIATSFVLLCAPRLIMGIINLILEFLNLSLVTGHIIPFFNNEYNLFTAIIVNNIDAVTNPWAYPYSIVLAAFYFALAVLLFTRRKSEFATHPYANQFSEQMTKIVACTILVLCGILFFAIDIYLIFLTVIMCLIAVGGYFISSVVAARKEKNFRQSMIAFPIFIAVNALIVIFIVAAHFILASYSPTKDEITSASVVVGDTSGNYYYDEYVDLRSEDIEITDKTVHEIVATALERGIDLDSYMYNMVTMKIKTGNKTAYRYLYLTDDEFAEINMARSMDDDYEKLWMEVSEGAENVSIYNNGIEIAGDDAMAILTAMENEINSIGFANWYSYFMYETPVAYIEYTVYYAGSELHITLPIPESLTETVSLYEQTYNRLRLDAYNQMKEALYNAVNDSDGLEVYFYYFSKEYYYTIETDICKSNPDSQQIVDTLISMISLEDTGDYENTIEINYYSNGLSYEYYYGSYSVADNVTESQVIEFFETYGYSY